MVSGHSKHSLIYWLLLLSSLFCFIEDLFYNRTISPIAWKLYEGRRWVFITHHPILWAYLSHISKYLLNEWIWEHPLPLHWMSASCFPYIISNLCNKLSIILSSFFIQLQKLRLWEAKWLAPNDQASKCPLSTAHSRASLCSWPHRDSPHLLQVIVRVRIGPGQDLAYRAQEAPIPLVSWAPQAFNHTPNLCYNAHPCEGGGDP